MKNKQFVSIFLILIIFILGFSYNFYLLNSRIKVFESNLKDVEEISDHNKLEIRNNRIINSESDEYLLNRIRENQDSLEMIENLYLEYDLVKRVDALLNHAIDSGLLIQ